MSPFEPHPDAQPDITSLDIDSELLAQQLAHKDTIAWDAIYAIATKRAQATGFAQLILERGIANYELVDGADPQALRLDRLQGAKIHVVLDWP
jgi:hypothetical protein